MGVLVRVANRYLISTGGSRSRVPERGGARGGGQELELRRADMKEKPPLLARPHFAGRD